MTNTVISTERGTSDERSHPAKNAIQKSGVCDFSLIAFVQNDKCNHYTFYYNSGFVYFPMSYYVYIVTNDYRTTLYIGITNDLQRRIGQHYFDSQNAKKSFAGKYNCYNLVYYETFQYAKDAIAREKQLKKWRREKKNKLISDFNPKWEALNNQVF